MRTNSQGLPLGETEVVQIRRGPSPCNALRRIDSEYPIIGIKVVEGAEDHPTIPDLTFRAATFDRYFGKG